MPPLVFGLLGVAAVLHAAWNIILKTTGDPLRTAGRGMIAATAAGLPLAIVGWVAIGRPAIPTGAVTLGVLSGLLEVAYFVLLAGAYRRGDLSVVYPIARGTAPLLSVGVGVIVLGERLSVPGLLGVGALVAGILVVQQPWRAVGWLRRSPGGAASSGRDTAVLFALATGVVIAAYSAVDRVGARLIEPWLYAAILFLVGAVGLAIWIGVANRLATDDRPQPAPWPRAAGAGLITLLAYLFVLLAYTVAPLAIVAPLRESAVVLVSGWGSFRLGEVTERREGLRRLSGAALVLIGALIIGVGR